MPKRVVVKKEKIVEAPKNIIPAPAAPVVEEKKEEKKAHDDDHGDDSAEW